jgi:hypothetical protein
MHEVSRCRLLCATLVALSSACAAPYHQGEASGALATRLYFTNESLDQAAIYAGQPGLRPIRIGTVMAGRTEVIVVPSTVMGGSGQINVFARPLGRDAGPDTGPLTLNPGEALSIRLPMDQRTLIVLPPGS